MDWDNLAKGVQDSLKGIAWHDDDQVVTGSCTKRYAERGESGYTLVTITRP
jgi:Holliday junction resolvase RusA-like endonuclease